MEIVRSLNRSWIYDTYFSLYRPIHSEEKSGGNVKGEYPSIHTLKTVYLISPYLTET